MAYSFQQLEQIWQEGGGSAALAPVMAAIALAESSGNPSAIGPGGSWGLWQIQPQDWSFSQTTDPITQASDANSIYQQQGLTAWSTYTGGEYLKYLQGNSATLSSTQIKPPQVSPGPNPAQGVNPPPTPDYTNPGTSSTPGSQSSSLAGPPANCVFYVGPICMDGVVGFCGMFTGMALLIVSLVLAF